MGSVVVPCFVEDDGHKTFLEALLRRLAQEEGWPASGVEAEFRNSTGGSGKALSALRRYLVDARKGTTQVRPLLVVLLDGNCEGRIDRKRRILKLAEAYGLSQDSVVAGVPDPHIERRFLDGSALKSSVDPAIRVTVPAYKCERRHYKQALRVAFLPAGIQPVAGGVEYADDIVPHIDLMKPACGDDALSEFADDLRSALRRLRGMSH